MAQSAAGGFPTGRNVADEFDAIGVGRFGRIQFLIRAFDAIDDGREGDVAIKLVFESA